MITDMFEIVSEAVTNFVSAVGNALQGVVALFYTSPTTSGGTGSFTFLGTLLLIGVGVGLIYWAIRLIRSLIAARRA